MSSKLRFIRWVRFFKRNCIIKWVIFFGCFCWLWDFLLKNLKLRKKLWYVHWHVWTNIKKLYTRKNIWKKNKQHKIMKISDLDPDFGWDFVFWVTALGRFSQCFFFFSIFRRRSAMAAKIFIQPAPSPYHEKASSGPVYWPNIQWFVTCLF